MEEKKSKIPLGQIIIQLVDLVNRNKIDDMYERCAELLEQESFPKMYKDGLRRVLRGRPQGLKSFRELSAPVAKFLVMDSHEGENAHVYIGDAINKEIEDLAMEWSHRDLFMEHRLGVRTKILLHGPTGNGKTTLARHIATKAGLPFVQISTESLLDSHMGASGQNIKTVFSAITQPSVLFLDEIDSLCQIRGAGSTSAAGMENDRVTNAFLVHLETLSPDVVFIGATNRQEALDAAVIRRFDSCIEIPAPSIHQRYEFYESLCKYHGVDLGPDPKPHVFKNFSDIKSDVLRKARAQILEKIKTQ